MNETYVAKEPGMIKYLEKVNNLASTFKEFSIKQVPRGEQKADALSKISSTSFAHLSKQVLVEELKEKSIDEKDVLVVVGEEGRTWMTHIHEYLVKEILPQEKKKSKGCAPESKEARRSCSMHAGPRSVVAKALRSGYYWPTMHADARKLIRECSDCQGIDIAGLFSKGPGKVKFLILAIDYFTKWIEAKPVETITGAQVKKFVWDNIVCRFGLPGEIISENEKQFRDDPFKDWCEKLCIRQRFAFVKHPQANSLVERANRSLGEGIKARTKAVVPVEIGKPTWRTEEVHMIKNDEALEINLDLLEEKREQAVIQEAKSKAMMENTIMPGFVTQVSSQETSSTEATKQAMGRMEASSDLSRKDHMKSRKH
nr:hypothetical protein [Tanacetum cinerariifolium]